MNHIMMPPGGQTTDESLIVKWHKQTGDKIKQGDVLFEIETDKATLEVQSYCNGYLRKIKYPEGEKVSAGEIVAYIGELDETIPETDHESETDAEKIAGEDAEYQPILCSIEKKDEDYEVHNVDVPGKCSEIWASPSAKKTAKDHGIEISKVPSDSGIIKREDVISYLNDAVSNAFGYYTVPMSNMRKTIARRMHESVQTAPHYTIAMEVDMGACMKLRSQINGYMNNEQKITFNDFIVKCTAKAIIKYPMINVVYDENSIKVFKAVNVGLAVGMENGLVVPVVKDVNSKSLTEIARENKENVQKVQSGRLKSDEMSGGTITISNLGMFGVDKFTAVINQPESCILAIGAIREKAISESHEIVSKEMMSITASFDHRVIDGVLGAQFLNEVKVLLENPVLLLA